ncbi:hypothetical protein GH714_029509 [Hevea brasiliensis]|uniref:Disease resistance R13L4/SHOC-2-like LRR domain-containing protein n=1 Tax=Hevea brasiliensis TaxID=3981 RepID=A0A6A6K9B8_HEVBR|nr:hypothetical protein GH714_029509 [Hevea brasiliensis]
MLESPAPAAQPDSTTVVKRYAPPNQRQAFFAFYLFVWYLLRNPNMRNKLAFLELNVDFLTVVNMINVFAAKMKILSTVIFPKHGKVLCIKQLSYRFDRSNSLYASDAEKNQQFAPPRNLPIVDHVDVGSSNVLNENSRPGLISLDGCCRSEASQLLNDRWALAMHNYNDDSIDLSERPVMYSSAWGQFRLPHQIQESLSMKGLHLPSTGGVLWQELFLQSLESDGRIQEFYSEIPSGTTMEAHVIPNCRIQQDKEEVRLLLAQGLIPEKPEEIMEDTVENIIKELIGLGMLQEHYHFYSKIQVSEFYEKSCLVKVKEQDFVSKAANSPIHAFIDNDGQDLHLPPSFKSLLIRSLFAYVRDCDDHINGAFSQVCLQTICGLQFLLVLDLYGVVEYLADEVGDLIHLKYLCLSKSNIKKLPPTIANLQKLQTLEVHNCSKLFELPVEILNIKQLRHLLLCDIIEYDCGIRVPMGIGKLENLQTCTGIYAGTGIASELSNLTQLRNFMFLMCLRIMPMSYLHPSENWKTLFTYH